MKVAIILLFALFGYAQCVIRGSVVKDHSIPYQAHITLKTDFYMYWNCSGVLLSQRSVLTTSKCFWSGPTHASLALGVDNIREPDNSRQSFDSRGTWRIYPEDFTYETLENNIGIMRLPSAASLNKDVQIATLASSDDVQVGQTGRISGWGVNGDDLEDDLKYATVTVVPNSVCAQAYPEMYVGSKTICVQGVNGAAVCNGDGGAPLVINDKVVGVFSAGPYYVNSKKVVGGCSGRPHIFTKVSSYIDWIKERAW